MSQLYDPSKIEDIHGALVWARGSLEAISEGEFRSAEDVVCLVMSVLAHMRQPVDDLDQWVLRNIRTRGKSG